MCKTFAIKEKDIIHLGYVKNKTNHIPNTPRIRANTISSHSTGTSKSVEEAYSDLMNNSNMEDPDDFFGLKLPDLMDIEENQETQQQEGGSKSSHENSEDEVIIEKRKKKTDLQKLCGFQSYQHVIEKAIYCSEEKMLTLYQIYNWIEENIPYFDNLSKNNKSTCWKNAIRHNLSLHKQFYKVLREGHRSCLWAVDKSRIMKGEKTKKVASILLSTFRPRSQTDPISMKTAKNFLTEKTVDKIESKPYEFLIPQMDSISSGKSSVETLPRDPVNDSYSSPSSNASSGLSSNYERVNKDAYVTNLQSWNYEQSHEHYDKIKKPKLKRFHKADYISFMPHIHSTDTEIDCFNVSPPIMELDYQAIIEHERHLYEANYPQY